MGCKKYLIWSVSTPRGFPLALTWLHSGDGDGVEPADTEPKPFRAPHECDGQLPHHTAVHCEINHTQDQSHVVPHPPIPPSPSPLTLLRPCDCGRYCSALCQSPLLIQQLVPAVDALCAHTLHSGSETNCTTLQRYYAMKLTLSSPMMSTI